MRQRPIKEQEKILIQYLLELLHNGEYFEVPQIVYGLDDEGMQNIRLTSNSQTSYLRDLIQVKYLDDDNILVLITLTQSNTNELLELEFWKVYSNKLITYPTPERVKYINNSRAIPGISPCRC
jgi:hypothetical protein